MVKESPKWLQSMLAVEDIPRIREAIRQAEIATTGEVVPMVVRRSSTVGHVYPLLGFCLFSLCLMFTHEPFWFTYVGYHGPLVIGSAFVLSFLVAWPLSTIPLIQRYLTTARDRWQQTCQRAELEFFKAGLHKTKEKTGILIFISLLEHQVYVLADTGISDKLPPETWREVSLMVTQAIKQDNFAKGLMNAIERCGSVLAEHFPANHKNPNELRDQIIIAE